MKKQRHLSPDSIVSEENSKQNTEEPQVSLRDGEDLQMCHRVLRLLGAYGHPALRDLKVSAHAGSVILQGTVPTYYLKQLAQSQVLHLEGVQLVQNEVEVVSPGAMNDHFWGEGGFSSGSVAEPRPVWDDERC